MKTTFIKRALLGFPLGIAIGYTISIVLSVFFANGYYGAVNPDLAITFGNEINAVIVQAILWGGLGFVFSGFSVIWEKDDWSLVKQTIMAFFAYLLPMMIVGYILKWYTQSILQVVVFILIFVFIFVAIWIAIYLKTKKDVEVLNEKIKNK